MNIVLIRHGETQANIKSGAQPILTTKGKHQIAALAKRFKKSKFDIIYSSDLERASLTAKELKKTHKNLKLIETEELQEIYRLIIGGAPKKGTSKHRLKDNLERAETFWNQMLKWKYDNVAVVCHGNIIRFFLSKALAASRKCFYDVEIYPTSISVIQITKDHIRVVLVNDVLHTPKRYLTQNSIYVE